MSQHGNYIEYLKEVQPTIDALEIAKQTSAEKINLVVDFNVREFTKERAIRFLTLHLNRIKRKYNQ